MEPLDLFLPELDARTDLACGNGIESYREKCRLTYV